jgi:enamine deaminase RidA (YjgF/YER057c/UK114 family)
MNIDPDARLAAAADTAPDSAERPALLPVGRAGRLVVTSGQVAVQDGTLLAHGTVGGQVDLATARMCARQCARNVLAALARELGSLSLVESVVRLTVYVASAEGFEQQHLVADAATELVLEVFGTDGAHARTAIGVRALPLGSPVEVDMILALR